MKAGKVQPETRLLRGNEPLQIDGHCAWLVQSGVVAIFSVRSDKGMEGMRHHLFTIASGEAILWSPVRDPGFSLLAVALEATQLVKTSLVTVAESALEGDVEATRMVRLWARHLENQPSSDFHNTEQALAALATLQADFIQSIDVAHQLRQEHDRRRFDARQQLNSQLAREAIVELASVAGQSPEDVVVSTDGSALLVAVRRVGLAQGLTISAPREDFGGRDPLDSILDASHARFRHVLLSGRWFNEDAGPLLAFRTEGPEGRIPVALIPIRRSIFSGPRYKLFEGSKPGIVVDKNIAASLEPVAVTFYTPLPGRTGIMDLLGFALRGRRRDCITALTAGLAATLLGMLIPQATLILFEHAIPDADRMMLVQIGFGLAAAAAGALLFDLSRSFSMLRLETYAVTSLQAGLWDTMLRQSPAFFRRYKTGDLKSRVESVSQIHQLLNESMISTIFLSLVSVLNLALMFYYSAGLAIIAMLIALVAAVISCVSGYFMLKVVRPLQELEGDLFGLMVQLVDAVPKLRIAGAEERAFAQWGHSYSRKQRLRQELQVMTDRVRLSGVVMSPLASAILFWYAGSSGAFSSLGMFMAFNAAFGIFLAGATSLGDSTIVLLSAGNVWKRMQPILDAEPEIDSRKSNPGQLRGRVDIDHVTFRYREGGPLTLDNVSLHVEPGECIAIVGPSGSGKSTLVNMLLRFESPSQGAIYYDGHDLNSLDVHAVRRQLGVVTQDNKIMAGSIYDNIVCGSLRTMAEAWESARAAGLAEDIEQMPMGMHTVVSEAGGNVSGGQRQRLLIARAMVQKPKILILDEATSALDNRTQSIVTESLDRLKVTRIVVAHRLSTIRRADRIYVIEQGRVVQEGRFDELFQQEGLFRRLMQRQTV